MTPAVSSAAWGLQAPSGELHDSNFSIIRSQAPVAAVTWPWPFSLFSEKGQGQVTAATGACDQLNYIDLPDATSCHHKHAGSMTIVFFVATELYIIAGVGTAIVGLFVF